jgi:glucose/arabinose dehydrogenase
MLRLLKISLLLIAVIIFFSGVVRLLFFKNTPNTRSATLLASNRPRTNKSVEPLELPTGFQISILTNKVPGARDLQVTPENNLLVTLPAKGKVVYLSLKEDHPEPKEILTGLYNPHGLAFYNNKLFVAEENQVSRYSWDEKNLRAKLEKKLFTTDNAKIPSGGGHRTRSIVFDNEGRLYISIGSTCNVCIEKNSWNAAVIQTDQEGNNPQIFSKGLRNAVFLATNPETNQIWVTEMGRDNLGDDLPADEINILKKDGDYGWPYCYGQKVFDQNFGQQSASYCQKTISPIFEIPAHSAPLGIAFVKSTQFPGDWQGDALVAYHGSWNRSEPTGYKVVRMKRSGDRLTSAEDFLTGFTTNRQLYGRPVDVTFDAAGNLYVSDDKAGQIYKVEKAAFF